MSEEPNAEKWWEKGYLSHANNVIRAKGELGKEAVTIFITLAVGNIFGMYWGEGGGLQVTESPTAINYIQEKGQNFRKILWEQDAFMNEERKIELKNVLPKCKNVDTFAFDSRSGVPFMAVLGKQVVNLTVARDTSLETLIAIDDYCSNIKKLELGGSVTCQD